MKIREICSSAPRTDQNEFGESGFFVDGHDHDPFLADSKPALLGLVITEEGTRRLGEETAFQL
jgi:hypothetical protein